MIIKFGWDGVEVMASIVDKKPFLSVSVSSRNE